MADFPVSLATFGSSALVGLSVAAVARQLTVMATSPRPDHLLLDGVERQRRQALRASSRTYRWFEPLVDRLVKVNESWFHRQLISLQSDLELLEPTRGWKAAEFLAVKQLESISTLLVGALFGYVLLGILGAPLVGILVLVATPLLIVRSLAKRANAYRAKFRTRLPFVIDLMALMLESGSIVRDCIGKAAEENQGHPIGDELGRVCINLDRGVTQAEALRMMARRLEDADLNEAVFVINTAEERGTPLRDILRDLAERMRVRRVQWREQAAEEAKVLITWPALLLMVACLLIIASPHLLQAINTR